MQKKRAFTLIELVVVMALIAILATLVIAAILAARNAANDTTRRSSAHSIQVALEAFYAAKKVYPSTATETLTDLVSAINADGGNYLDARVIDDEPDKANGERRYCYAPSRQGYVLGVWMGVTVDANGAECNPADPDSTTAGTTTGTGTEDFSLNP